MSASRSTSGTTITTEMLRIKLPRATGTAKRLYGSLVLRCQRPLQRLPNELLSHIFLFATHHHHDRFEAIASPITISHVCSRWRQVALTTGGLWTNLIITFPTSRGQLSRTVTWLSRSKTYPLDLLLDFRDPSWDWEENSHAFRWQDMEVVLRLLLTHVSRWRRFELLTDTWAPIFTFLWYTRRIESAPLLQTIALSRCNAYFAANGEVFQPTSLKQPIPLFGGLELKNLRQVSLAGVHVDWSKSSLCNLTELEFKYHARDIMPTPAQFVDILNSCPDLQHLSVIGWGPKFRVPPHSPDSRASDEEPDDLVKLKCSIRLPHLTHFSLGFIDTEYAIQLLSLFDFPALEELSLEDVSVTLNPSESQDATPILAWLVSNHAPACTCPSLPHSSACTANRPFPLQKIGCLDLHAVHSSEIQYSTLFHELSALERLGFFGVTNNVFDALAPQPSLEDDQVSGSKFPCALLSTLECRDIDSNALADMVVARAASDSVTSIERVFLDFKSRESQPLTSEETAKLAVAGVKITIEGDNESYDA